MSKYNLFYCPFCCRNIEPECDEFGDEIEMPEGGRMYVHDDVPHDLIKIPSTNNLASSILPDWSFNPMPEAQWYRL